MGGTSMAAPVLTGIIALMLEANPNLSISDVKNIIQNTAMTDSFTESTSATPNNYWGAGKIDALASIQYIESSLSIEPLSNHLNFKLYPNPSRAIISFDNAKMKFETLEVVNLLRQSILKINLKDKSKESVDISKFGKGIYIFKFIQQGNFSTFKVVKE